MCPYVTPALRSTGLWEGGREDLGDTKYPERPLRSGAVVAQSLCLRPPAGRAPPPRRQRGRQVIAGRRGHVNRAGAPELAMAAVVSSVVRRVEELGDLAQAHIQHLSEAAGEDGEGAPQLEAGGRW